MHLDWELVLVVDEVDEVVLDCSVVNEVDVVETNRSEEDFLWVVEVDAEVVACELELDEVGPLTT